MEKIEAALKEFKKRKVLVIGDIILDKFTYGEIKRVNPEQPAAPLAKVLSHEYALGGAANVANNIVALEASCCLYGIVGKDDFGKKIKRLCEKKGIILRSFSNNQQTIVKQRIMAHGQQIARLDHGEKNLEKIKKREKEELIASLEKEIKQYDFVILSDYDKQVFDKELSQKIIDLSNSLNIPVLVDPKPSNIECFKNCTIIRPNKYEAEKITGIKYQNEEDHLKKMSEALSNIVNSKYVIITCGKDGIFCYDKEKKESLFVGTKAREVANVTGAGDTFAATLALGLGSGLNLSEAAKLANYSAGVVVEKIGTALPSIEEIKNKIKQDNKL